MKSWWLIDEKDGDIFETRLNIQDKDKAKEFAEAEWERLSTYDKKHRKAFWIGLGEENENGLDWDTISETENIK